MARKITIRTTARPSSNGRSIRVRTSVSNGRTTRTSSKTYRVK
jgi:hypothetical protein